MTAVRLGRGLRGRSEWARMAWALLRAEMDRARELVRQGETYSAARHLREAKALAIQARTFDRHHGPARGRIAC